MKYNKISVWVLLAISSSTVMTPHRAFASGSGVRDGGHIVRQDGQRRLLDMVSQTGCREWLIGDELLSRNPVLQRVLASLSQVDWYFAHALKAEILGLSYCMAANLQNIPAFDYFPVFRLEGFGGLEQGALRDRWTAEVYVNFPGVAALPPLDQAALWIHEALHGFIGFEDGRHYEHVRTMSRFIANLTVRTQSREVLHRFMEHERVEFPRVVNLLDRHRTAFEFSWSTLQEQEQAVLVVPAPESLVMSDLDYQALLPMMSGEQWYAQSPMSTLIETLKRLLINEDFSIFEQVLTQKTYSTISIGDVGMSVASRLTPQKRQRLFAILGGRDGVSVSVIDEILKRMQLAQVYFSQSSVCANSALVALSGRALRSSGCVTVMSLIDVDHSELPFVEFDAASQMLREWIAQGEWDFIANLVGNQGRLRAAFNLSHLKSQIAGLPESSISVRREKIYAQEQVDLLTVALWERFISNTAQSLLPQDANRLKNLAITLN